MRSEGMVRGMKGGKGLGQEIKEMETEGTGKGRRSIRNDRKGRQGKAGESTDDSTTIATLMADSDDCPKP